MSRVTIAPEQFTLVQFDSTAVRGLVEDCAELVGFPAGVDITLEVDEVLPLPLTGTQSDVVDGRVALWATGGTFEHPHYTGQLHEPIARAELAAMLLRAKDRLAGGFAGAPIDAELSDRARAVWDVYTDGRLERIGVFFLREPRRRYAYRLYAGFNDVADAEYEQLRVADALDWPAVVKIVERLEAADPREQRKRPSARRPLRTS